ncbi:MAG: putative baseplate assembly protein, partial [Acidobacteria bacterium]|nr:putative baseplate assembly protein [Acidobacteriota bacterium]
RFRMAGQDLEIDAPRFVPLDLALRVCVLPGYFRSDVRRELVRRFGTGSLGDGRRGFFHPDEWSFGQPLYLSRVYEAAAGVDGVESVEVERFQRLGRPPVPVELEDGALAADRLEILRLDNDPSFQENGRLEITLGGGR